MTDFSLRAARIQLGALLAALALAIVIALGITTGAFVLSFAVQRDLARQALIPENLTWIFPAIVDSAILGSTMAIVLISKLKMNRRDRGFYISLAVSVVVISILGNAFHAYNAAVDARTFVAGGGDLGFIPLVPAIAAALAIIPPALVLAFTHGVTVLVKAVACAYAAYRELVDSHAAPVRPAAPAVNSIQLDTVSTELALLAAKTQVDPRNNQEGEQPCNDDTAAKTGDGTATTAETASSNDATFAITAAPTAAHLDDLEQFIADSNLPDAVKDTARRKLANRHHTWETIAADSLPPVATSTAWRRYEKFDTAARAAGFDSPPLPDLRAAENAVEHTADRELVAAY